MRFFGPQKFNLRLKFALAQFSKFKPIKWLLVAFYRLHLFCFYFFLKKQKGITAILLRRKGVLADFVPGESDFDLTCILSSSIRERFLSRFSFFYTGLKFIFPFLEELLFVSEKDFEEHIKYDFGIYGGLPHVVWSQEFLSIEPSFSPISFKRRLLVVWLDTLTQWYTVGEKQGWEKKWLWRRISKNQHKIGWLVNCLKTQKVSDLVYDESLEPANFLKFSNQLETSCLVNTSGNHLRVPIRVKGDLELFSSKEMEKVYSFSDRYSTALESEFFSVSIAAGRLYKFASYVTAVPRVFQNSAFNPSQLSILSSLREFTKTNHLDEFCGGPFVVTKAQRDAVFKIDELAGLLFNFCHFDLIKKEFYISNERSASISWEMLNAEITETIVVLSGLIRTNQTHLFLGAVLGRLLAYRYLLETGTLFLSYKELLSMWDLKSGFDRAQNEVFEIFSGGVRSEILNCNRHHVWKTMREPVLLEINRLRSAKFNYKAKLYTATAPETDWGYYKNSPAELF